MAPASPTQMAWRRRIESVLGVVAPALDLVLAAGDRLSRVVEPEDLDWTPPRSVSSASRPPAAVGPGPARPGAG